MIDLPTFKTIMAAAPGPAAVVTAMGADGQPYGLTVSAVCSVSLAPSLALACLDRGSNTLAAIEETNAFTINYLATGREPVALHFATKSDRKFDGHRWVRPEGGTGGPILLDAAAAHVVCRVEQAVPAGDHIIVVGSVVEGAVDDSSHALAYARRRFFTGEYLDLGAASR
ncbi:flavin reductase family protein [Amycolatopsis sp. Poz14]|uniref:flavin reductase family protein n=1 Tax=Amycolatopsis sp. Poz14 TaxID=1447705 RepID=UPI001EE89009|nr:flavin reductase family protein [Amycolatopsis sp. Poz14]MCG3754061.1 flavin reductase family protein [Amycolatopsis sp. Poz14]